ncbi:MAG: hypothetical protein KBG75_02330 [Pseudomonadales bacterium]|nr:hypothetical protein [Pseudomonadales bacterium]
MKTGKDLAQQAARGLAASSKTSRTAAGRTEARGDSALVDAINQVFALFRLNYHNQYYSAFGDGSQLNQVKKLWLDSLASHSIEAILLGARHCIETSEYLPTLHRMLECCREAHLKAQGLPEVHAAYREACLAPEPKHAQGWSHPAVYHAGRETGWFLLASSPESKSFPAFERCYRALCDQLAAGATLALPSPGESTANSVAAPDIEQQRAQLARLRSDTGI